jgi:hypothetical protein
MRIELRRVDFMPKELEQGVLYVSDKYRTAAHLCACGCGEKIRTPLGPTEWSVSEGRGGPSVWPSIGSWQRPCRSHYVINDGVVHWADQWSDTQVRAGRQHEQLNRETYYAAQQSSGGRRSLWSWLKGLFKQLR